MSLKGFWGSIWGGDAWGGSFKPDSRDATKDITGSIRLYAKKTSDISGAVDIKKSNSAIITGSAVIAGDFLKNIYGATYINNPNQQVGQADINGVVSVLDTYTREINGSVRVEKYYDENITGAVYIETENTSDVSGMVTVRRIESKNISGRVTVRVSTPEKLPETWEKYQEPAPQDWGMTEKSPEEWATPKHIESQDWHYPFEDIA